MENGGNWQKKSCYQCVTRLRSKLLTGEYVVPLFHAPGGGRRRSVGLPSIFQNYSIRRLSIDLPEGFWKTMLEERKWSENRIDISRVPQAGPGENQYYVLLDK